MPIGRYLHAEPGGPALRYEPPHRFNATQCRPAMKAGCLNPLGRTLRFRINDGNIIDRKAIR
jgi:hypothetical protein